MLFCIISYYVHRIKIVLQANQQMDSPFTTHHHLIAHLAHSPWKQQIGFFHQLQATICQRKLHNSTIFEKSWLTLLNQKNINVLIKTVAALNCFSQHYTIHSLTLQRQLMQKLFELAKMKNPQINTHIAQTICYLIAKEKRSPDSNQRALSLQQSYSLFNKFNNPTFLCGNSLGLTAKSLDSDVSSHENQNICPPYLLQYLAHILKRCSKQVLDVIAEAAKEMKVKCVLDENESKYLCVEMGNRRSVIAMRRHSGTKPDRLFKAGKDILDSQQG